MALSAAVQQAFRQAQNGGGGRRAALPDGTRVLAQIQPTRKDIGFIERRPLAKDASNRNHGIVALALRFVVPEGQQHAGRNFFANVPVSFETFKRDGSGMAVSYQSIGLVTALGYVKEGELPDENLLKDLDDRELIGKPVSLVLGVEDDNKFDPSDPDEAAKAQENPLYAKRNNIKFINAPKSSPASAPVAPGGSYPAPSAPPAPANDPWAAAATASADDPWASAAGATV